MCCENEGTIKELLVQQFDHWRSKNRELLELGLELETKESDIAALLYSRIF